MDFSFNPFLAFGWSVLTGFMASMGAGGGGILAGIGHISVLGVGDPNTVKVLNQTLEFTSRVVSVPLYHQQRRLVGSVALTFGIGAPIGAGLGSWVSKHFMANMVLYRPAFGGLIVLVGCRVLYEAWARRAQAHAALQKAAQASMRATRNLRLVLPGARVRDAARSSVLSWRTIRVRFGGEDFDYSPLSAAAGGFAVSFIGAVFGVGGGFLAGPFMASVLLLPMYLVVGTSLLALLVPLAVSVATYLLLDVPLNGWLLAVEIPGVVVGSLLGPPANRHMNEKALKTFVAVVLLGIGLFYLVH